MTTKEAGKIATIKQNRNNHAGWKDMRALSIDRAGEHSRRGVVPTSTADTTQFQA
ncbi:MAG: hypothetical protein WD648_03785 [Planctomycetaceae bacterium]